MKQKMMILCILLACALLSGCGVFQSAAPTATATYPPPITTEPAPPTNTPLPSATRIPPTPTVYQPINGKILFDDMRLRRGPGFLFETIQVYPIDQTIELLGYAPGGNWYYVRTVDGLTGWMKKEGIDLEGNMYDAPEVAFDDAVVVHGRVSAPNGSPASEIGVAIQPEGDDNPSRQDVGVTDVMGRFYIYLPPGTSGHWILAASSYGCAGSNVDRTCSLIGHFPEAQVITLPEAASTPIEIQILP